MSAGTVMLIACFVLLAFCLFMMARNEWTCRAMHRLLGDVSRLARADIDAGRPWEWRYETFPNYDAVMWRFWIWDIEYFRSEGCR